MRKEWAYIPGDYYMICDVCGEKHRKSEMKQRWDNLWVDKRCWNPRQPQDFVQARTDIISVPVARPRPVDVFTGPAVLGTYANDATAASGGVSIGSAYIQTPGGNTVVRIT